MKLRILKMLAPFITKLRLHPKTELGVFIKRNTTYLMICVLCILLCVKQSDAPYLWNYNVLTTILFEKPDSKSAWGSVFFFMYELGLAFLASFLFYLTIILVAKDASLCTDVTLLIFNSEKISGLYQPRNFEHIDFHLGQCITSGRLSEFGCLTCKACCGMRSQSGSAEA